MNPQLPTEPRGPSPARERVRRRWVIGWLLVAALAAAAFVITLARTADVAVLGLLGGAAAIALAVVAHHLVVTRDAGERRLPRPDTSALDLPTTVNRRHLVIGGAVVAGAGLLGVLGLRRFVPERPPGSTWEAGAALVTIDEERVRPEDVPVGGVVTVWPEGLAGTERAAVMLLRLRDLPEAPTRTDAVVDSTLVAYSRLCTHAGCAVALYRHRDQALFCPCHQATFDARRGARPTAGPASVPLPQLPLGLSGDGYLIATGDLTGRPGPVGSAT